MPKSQGEAVSLRQWDAGQKRKRRNALAIPEETILEKSAQTGLCKSRFGPKLFDCHDVFSNSKARHSNGAKSILSGSGFDVETEGATYESSFAIFPFIDQMLKKAQDQQESIPDIRKTSGIQTFEVRPYLQLDFMEHDHLFLEIDGLSDHVKSRVIKEFEDQSVDPNALFEDLDRQASIMKVVDSDAATGHQIFANLFPGASGVTNSSQQFDDDSPPWGMATSFVQNESTVVQEAAASIDTEKPTNKSPKTYATDEPRSSNKQRWSSTSGDDPTIFANKHQSSSTPVDSTTISDKLSARVLENWVNPRPRIEHILGNFDVLPIVKLKTAMPSDRPHPFAELQKDGTQDPEPPKKGSQKMGEQKKRSQEEVKPEKEECGKAKTETEFRACQFSHSVIRVEATIYNGDVFWRPWLEGAPPLNIGSGLAVVLNTKNGILPKEWESRPMFVTSAENVRNAQSVTIEIPPLGEERYPVEVCLFHELQSLALLCLKDGKVGDLLLRAGERKFALAAIPIADSSGDTESASDPSLRLGQDVGVLSFPLGAPAMVFSRGVLAGIEERAAGTYLQTTAAFSQHSQGGPLIDLEGSGDSLPKVVGIMVETAHYSRAQQNNYAVTLRSLRQVLHECIEIECHLHQKRPKLPVAIPIGTVIRPSAELYAAGACKQGVAVAWIPPGSILTGVSPYSFVESVDGMPIDTYGYVRPLKGHFGEKIPATAVLGLKDLVKDPSTVVTCKHGHKSQLRVSLPEVSPWGIKHYTQEVDITSDMYEAFPGFAVMELTMNHLFILARKVDPWLSLYMDAEKRTHKRLLVIYTEPGTSAEEIISPGMVVSKLNGEKVFDLQGFRKFWIPPRAFEGTDTLFRVDFEDGRVFTVPFEKTFPIMSGSMAHHMDVLYLLKASPVFFEGIVMPVKECLSSAKAQGLEMIRVFQQVLDLFAKVLVQEKYGFQGNYKAQNAPEQSSQKAQQNNDNGHTHLNQPPQQEIDQKEEEERDEDSEEQAQPNGGEKNGDQNQAQPNGGEKNGNQNQEKKENRAPGKNAQKFKEQANSELDKKTTVTAFDVDKIFERIPNMASEFAKIHPDFVDTDIFRILKHFPASMLHAPLPKKMLQTEPASILHLLSLAKESPSILQDPPLENTLGSIATEAQKTLKMSEKCERLPGYKDSLYELRASFEEPSFETRFYDDWMKKNEKLLILSGVEPYMMKRAVFFPFPDNAAQAHHHSHGWRDKGKSSTIPGSKQETKSEPKKKTNIDLGATKLHKTSFNAVVRIITTAQETHWFKPGAKTVEQYRVNSGFAVKYDTTDTPLTSSERNMFITTFDAVRNFVKIWVQIPTHSYERFEAFVVMTHEVANLALIELREEPKFAFWPITVKNQLQYAPGLQVAALAFEQDKQSLKVMPGAITGVAEGARTVGFAHSAKVPRGAAGGPIFDTESTESKPPLVGMCLHGVIVPTVYIRQILSKRLKEISKQSKTNQVPVSRLQVPYLNMEVQITNEHLASTINPDCKQGVYVRNVGLHTPLAFIVDDGSLITHVRGVRINNFGRGRFPGLIGHLLPVEILVLLGDDIEDEFEIGVCDQMSHSDKKMSLAWHAKYEPGIPYLPHMPGGRVDFQVFAGVTVMQMTMSHVISLIAHGDVFKQRMLLPQFQEHPRLIVVGVEPGSYASEVFKIGDIVHRVNGKEVRRLADYDAVFDPCSSKETCTWTMEVFGGAALYVDFTTELKTLLNEAKSKSSSYLLNLGVLRDEAVTRGFVAEALHRRKWVNDGMGDAIFHKDFFELGDQELLALLIFEILVIGATVFHLACVLLRCCMKKRLVEMRFTEGRSRGNAEMPAESN